MEKKGTSIFFKNLAISFLVIIASIVLVLLGMAIEKNRNNDKKASDTSTTVEPGKKYESISDSEIDKITVGNTFTGLDKDPNETLLLLMEQDKDVSDVKAFLEDEYYNDWIIYNAVSSIVFKDDNYNKKVTKDEVLKVVKEMYGYDLELKFHDITEKSNGEEVVGYKWDEKTESYSYDYEEGAFQHGGYYNGYHNGDKDSYEFYQYTISDQKVTNNENNIYTVTGKILWNNVYYMTEGLEFPTKYYSTHSDAKNDKNAVVTLTEDANGAIIEVPAENVGEDYLDDIYDYVYEKADGELHTFEYKLVKEDGKIRIISYKLVK